MFDIIKRRHRKRQLPTNLGQFDELVKEVVSEFDLHDPNHAAGLISIAIRHLPPTQAYASLDYFGQYVMKNLANYVAEHKAQVMRHETEVDQLVSLLQKDPGDCQARDKLQMAANDGSIYAANALKNFELLPENPLAPNLDTNIVKYP